MDENNDVSAFEAVGHTGFAPRGSDIACAGASSVIQTAVLGCVRVLKITGGIEQEDGYLYFSLPSGLEKKKSEQAQAVLKTMLEGLNEIKRQFPEHLQIETRNLE